MKAFSAVMAFDGLHCNH